MSKADKILPIAEAGDITKSTSKQLEAMLKASGLTGVDIDRAYHTKYDRKTHQHTFAIVAEDEDEDEPLNWLVTRVYVFMGPKGLEADFAGSPEDTGLAFETATKLARQLKK